MRSFTFEHDGEEYTMTATFAAAEEVAAKVADPLFIAREAAVEAQMVAAGINYQTKFAFTVENLPKLFHIGMKAAHPDIQLSKVKELVFGIGLVESKEIAGRFLAMIVTPSSERKSKDEPKDKPGE